MFLINTKEYIDKMLADLKIDRNSMFLGFETAVRRWFSVKHPYNIVIIVNDKIELEENFDNIHIKFIKSKNININDCTLHSDGMYYQKPLSLLQEYKNNPELFLSNCETKDDIKDTMDESIILYKYLLK